MKLIHLRPPMEAPKLRIISQEILRLSGGINPRSKMRLWVSLKEERVNIFKESHSRQAHPSSKVLIGNLPPPSFKSLITKFRSKLTELRIMDQFQNLSLQSNSRTIYHFIWLIWTNLLFFKTSEDLVVSILSLDNCQFLQAVTHYTKEIIATPQNSWARNCPLTQSLRNLTSYMEHWMR